MLFCWPLDTFLQGWFLSLSPMLLLKRARGSVWRQKGRVSAAPRSSTSVSATEQGQRWDRVYLGPGEL